ncbi:MAG: TonB-dependent receptor, partial [Pseudomonadota bacterium]
PSGAQEDEKVLETIIVTARQNQENILDVPFAVSVFDEEAIKRRAFIGIEDAIKSVPGVDVNASGQPTLINIRIRGVGTLLSANRDDSSVSIIVDGVPTPTENASMSTLDIARIEVLKGPQSIVYGQNSEAGAINVTTNRPTDDFEANFAGRYGEQSQYWAEGTISGPIGGGLKGRLAVRSTGADNWIENTATGEPVTDLETFTVRGQLLWELDETEILVSGELHEFDDFVAAQLLRPYPDPPTIDVTPGRFADNDKVIDRAAVQVTHDFSSAAFTSISSFTTYTIDNEVAFDRSLNEALFGFPIEVVQNQDTDDETISQELRLASQPGADVFWVTGLSFLKSNRTHQIVNVGSPNTSSNDLETVSYGLYGEVTYPLTDAFSVTAGARLSHDEKEFSGVFGSGGSPVTDQRDLDDTYLTGRLALTYELFPGTNIYAFGSRGYKSGGFNEFATSVNDSEPYRRSVVNAFEVGVKTAKRDSGFSLSGAVFYNDIKDDQVGVFDPFTFASFAFNVDTESLGFELGSDWKITNSLSVNGALTYIDAEIKTATTAGVLGDISAGNGTPDTPEWSGNIGADWVQDLSGVLGVPDAVFEASVNFRYQDERPADAANNFNLDSYSKLDLRIGVSNLHGRIYLWGDNLLNEPYDLYGFSFGFPGSETGSPARGRTVGVGLDINFR